MVSDSIADLLTRIKNGYLVKSKTITVPYFKLGEKLVKILYDKGYLSSFSVDAGKKEMIINLKYNKKTPAVTDVKRVSRPGLRIYVSKEKIPLVLGGIGITVLTTSKGLMIGREAKKQGLGGELLCKVW